jgi:hypothetical protein
LPYVGGLYEPVEWKLVITPTGLNVSFTGTTIGPVSDVPVFTDGANTMSLSDPLWAGTYVRYPP